MVWVANATSRPLYPRERPGTRWIGGWVGPRAGLDWCGKSRSHRDSISGPSRPYRVATLTELSRPYDTSVSTKKKSDCVTSKTETPKYKMYENREHRIMVRHERQEITEGGLESVRCLIRGPLSPRHGASSGCGWRRRPPIWTVAANILNKQSRTADKGWSFGFGGWVMC